MRRSRTPISRRAGQGKQPLNEAELLSLFQKMIKQRQEFAELYDKGGRPELAQQERAEIDIIASYLPKQMSDIEAGAAITAILQEINAQGMKDMGRAMAALQGALRRHHGFRQGQRQDQGTAEQEIARTLCATRAGAGIAPRPRAILAAKARGPDPGNAPQRTIMAFSSSPQGGLKVFQPLCGHDGRIIHPLESTTMTTATMTEATMTATTPGSRDRSRRRQDPPAGRLVLRRLRRRRHDAADRRRRAVRGARPALRRDACSTSPPATATSRWPPRAAGAT